MCVFPSLCSMHWFWSLPSQWSFIDNLETIWMEAPILWQDKSQYLSWFCSPTHVSHYSHSVGRYMSPKILLTYLMPYPESSELNSQFRQEGQYMCSNLQTSFRLSVCLISHSFSFGYVPHRPYRMTSICEKSLWFCFKVGLSEYLLSHTTK